METVLPRAADPMSLGRSHAPTRNVAHRGASAHAPENTLSAIRGAIALDADLIEVDVQRTRDGVLVLMHDLTLLRTTDVRWVYPDRAGHTVADFTYAELLRLDAGSWAGGGFAGERVPTLRQAIDVIWACGKGLLLELKGPGSHPATVSELLRTLLEVPDYATASATDGRLIVQSFDFAAMKELKTQAPWVPVGLLGTPPRANLPVLGSWANQVNPRHRSIDQAYVDRVHELGMDCFVWTVNRPAAMRRVLDMGVDGVITNRPDVLARSIAAGALERLRAGEVQGSGRLPVR